MIVLQIIAALFALALAWLNKWPVLKFRESGCTIRGEKQFHAANALVKILWAVGNMSNSNVTSVLPRLYLFAVLLLVQWLVFDPALNVFTGKPWHYLGQTARLDKLVRNGKAKAAVVLVLLIALNFVL